jgi:hypothetical protein
VWAGVERDVRMARRMLGLVRVRGVRVSCGEYREDDEVWTMGYDSTMDLLLSDWDGRKMAFYLDTGSMFMDWERQNSLFSEEIVLNARMPQAYYILSFRQVLRNGRVLTGKGQLKTQQ